MVAAAAKRFLVVLAVLSAATLTLSSRALSASELADAQLLCFSAKWCQPCREMEPVVERLVRDGYPLRKLSIEDYGEIAKRYSVSAVPSFVLIDGKGQVVDRIDQATSLENLGGMMEHYGISPRAATVRGQSSRASVASAKSGLTDLARTRLKDQGPTAAVNSLSPEQTALESTVRLKVDDENGHSFGTGTVVDIHDREALVLTCGHIFRPSKGKGRILIDRFDTPGGEPTSGTLISYDMDLDVALVSMKLTSPIAIAPLAPLEYQAKKDEPVFSVGCSRGDPPSVMNGAVKQIDKYLGPPNITASGQPVDGRSGGGLFNRHGMLIGVCSAADPEFDEGLYGALPRVYYELDRNGLSSVYDKKKNPEGGYLSSFANSKSMPNGTPSPKATPPDTRTPLQLAHAVPRGKMKPGSDDEELVCVLRGEGETESRVFVIQNPSRVLLEYLGREAKQQNH